MSRNPRDSYTFAYFELSVQPSIVDYAKSSTDKLQQALQF